MNIKEYHEQVMTMADLARDWREKNPDREARVQFNFPKEIFLITPISNAVQNRFVVTNDAGLELIKALGEYGQSGEPTAFMVRLALEYRSEDTRAYSIGNQTCPVCGYRLDMSTPVGGGGPPKAGDLNVCLGCTSVLEFTMNGLRKLPDEDYQALPAETKRQLDKARAILKRLKEAEFKPDPNQSA